MTGYTKREVEGTDRFLVNRPVFIDNPIPFVYDPVENFDGEALLAAMYALADD